MAVSLHVPAPSELPPLRVLLVEDVDADAELVQAQLEAGWGRCRVVRARSLGDAIVVQDQGDVDVVLLDLSLPDGVGVEPIERLREREAAPPIVVLTGNPDPDLPVAALRAGAQDYLVKAASGPDAVIRAIRYAVERQRLTDEIAALRLREEHERETAALVSLVRASTGVTATLYDAAPLRHISDEVFDALVREHAALLELAWEAVRYGGRRDADEAAMALASRFGHLGAGPRDVVDVHQAALDRHRPTAAARAEQAYHDEARFALLQVMGYLAAHYRRLSVPMRTMRPDHDP